MAKRKATPRNAPAAPGGAPAVDDGDQLVVDKDLDALMPLHRSTRWRMARDGKFPRPIQITPARKAWRLSDIRQWLADREANPVAPRAYFRKTKTARETEVR
jgi:prophage regulatory protein